MQKRIQGNNNILWNETEIEMILHPYPLEVGGARSLKSGLVLKFVSPC